MDTIRADPSTDPRPAAASQEFNVKDAEAAKRCNERLESLDRQSIFSMLLCIAYACY
jgi:hypothetical protein